MGKTVPYLLIICILLIDPLCHAQTSVRIPDPRLGIEENTLVISYDILNSDPEEKYIISINIKDENGNSIMASALNGDIGMVENGGENKQITWDPAADNIFINSKIYVKVNAEIILPPKPVVSPPQDISAEDPGGGNDVVAKDLSSEEGSEAGEFNRAVIVLQSIAFPGLGLTKVTEKPHWIKGLAGYASLAGSLALNRVALNTYDDIDGLTTFEEKDALYQKSVNQNSVSRAFAYTALAIWVSDIIWTVVGTSDLNKNPGVSDLLELSVDPVSNTLMAGIKYSF